MLDIEEMLAGTAVVGLIGYVLIAIATSALIFGIEIWVLWNFFDLLEWAEQFGMVTLPIQAGIAVIALAGLSISLAVAVIAILVIIGVIGILLD